MPIIEYVIPMPMAAPPGTVFEIAVVDCVISIPRPNDSRGVVTVIQTRTYVTRFQSAIRSRTESSSQVMALISAHTSAKSIRLNRK